MIYTAVAIVLVHIGIIQLFETIDRRHGYRWKEDKLLYELSWPVVVVVVLLVIFIAADESNHRYYSLTVLAVAPMMYLWDLSLRNRKERTPLRDRQWRYFRREE